MVTAIATGSGSGGQCGGTPQICVNPATGNLSIQISTPGTGPGGAAPSLTYNSSDMYPTGAGNGLGWFAVWTQAIVRHPILDDGHITVHGCDGSVRHYTCPDENDEYKSPGMNPNTLKKASIGWIETEPSGREYHYSSLTKKLERIVDTPTGKRWTLIHDSTALTTALEDPWGRRTSMVYDTGGGGGTYQQDIHGRKMTFSEASGVYKISNPELCEVTYKYKSGYGNERLMEYIEYPDGGRYSFTYDDDHWIKTVTNPHGDTMTLTYVDYTTTHVDGFGGNRTTLNHSFRRNITKVTSAEGVITEYDWKYGRYNRRTNADGTRATLIHEFVDGHRLLKNEITPFGRTTNLYDASGFLTTHINVQGHRTTYVRDAGLLKATREPSGAVTTNIYDTEKRLLAQILPTGGRTTNVYGTALQVDARIDPFGNRTSFTYENGQATTVTNPLGNTSSTIYDDINRPLATIDALGNRSSFIYTTESCMNWLASINPLGNRTSNIFDNGRLESTINALGYRTSYVYDDGGNQIAAINPEGLRNSIVYNKDRQPVANISPAGLRSSTVYDAEGRAEATVAPNGARSTQVYDEDNGLHVAVIDPYGHRNTSVYDSTGRPIASVNPLGARSTQIYTACCNHVLATVNPLGNRFTSVYDGIGQMVASVDPLENRSSTVYDLDGSTIASIDPLGHRSTTVYNDGRQAVASIDPLGHRATSVFDATGRGIASITPLGFRSTTVYDVSGQAVASIDAEGNISTSVYDANGQSVASVDPLGNRSTTVYTVSGTVEATIDAAGNRTTPVYDAFGRNVATIDAIGNRTSMVYNSVGQSVASINALGFRTTNVFDSAGQVVAGIDPLGNRHTSVFDEVGQTIASVNPLGQRSTIVYDLAGQAVARVDANDRRTTSVFDPAGRPVGEINALDYITTTVYNAVGQTYALVDARGNRNTFLYDSNGQQTVLVDPLSRRTSYGYDADGRQTSRTDARGHQTDYSYSDRGLLVGREYPDGSRVTFAHDANGQQTLMHDATGRYTTSYDVLGQAHVVENPNSKTITYTYDAVGNRATMDAPDSGVFSYAYDASSQITLVHNPFDERTTFAYDNAGRRTVKRLANGTRASYTYDDASNLTKLHNLKSDNSAICTFDYQYDDAGNRTSVLEDTGDRVTWTYDDSYQLIAERRSGTHAYAHTFTYDASGNREVLKEDGVLTTTTYDSANQIVFSEAAAARTTYTFDANGNQQLTVTPVGDRTTNVWDYENRMISTLMPGNLVNTMTYKADGLRVTLEESTGTKTFLWDDQNYLSQSDGGALVFTNEPAYYGNLVSQHDGVDSSWYHFDVRGDTRRLTGLAESNLAEADYQAWGMLVGQSSGSLAIPFLFKGELGYYFDDAQGTYYVRARVYDPDLARFSSRDDYWPTAVEAAYAYCENRPIQNSDPSGSLSEELQSKLKTYVGILSLCGDSRLNGWFDRMQQVPGRKLDFRHYRGPVMGSLESRVSVEVHKLPGRCGAQPIELTVLAVAEATGSFKGKFFDSTSSQIRSAKLHVVGTRSPGCTPPVLVQPYKIGKKGAAVAAVQACRVRCKDGDCQPVKADNVLFASIFKKERYLTRPGQMLLWQWRVCPPKETEQRCCMTKCRGTTNLVQLEYGWNYNWRGEGTYTGPPWGIEAGTVGPGEEPRPTREKIPEILRAHSQRGGKVVPEC